MELVKESLVLIHLAGMAVLVGVFLTGMKKKSDYPFTAMMWAAIVQVVTGTLLVGIGYALGDEPDNAKIGVKLILATAVLVATILGRKRQAKGESKLQPFFHAAGGLATLSLVIAVLWNAELWAA
jgi:drug/metabolite transporter (DMT)-like permease